MFDIRFIIFLGFLGCFGFFIATQIDNFRQLPGGNFQQTLNPLIQADENRNQKQACN